MNWAGWELTEEHMPQLMKGLAACHQPGTWAHWTPDISREARYQDVYVKYSIFKYG